MGRWVLGGAGRERTIGSPIYGDFKPLMAGAQAVRPEADAHALGRRELFSRVVQSLIEVADGSERMLESIPNYVGPRGAPKERRLALFDSMEEP